jgi:predicted permease
MTELLRDIRYGLRLLWKSPGFTSVSLIALALGIGATTAIFSLLYSIFLAPLPYAKADQLVLVWSHYKGERISTSPADFQDWQRQSTVFQSLAPWTGTSFTIVTPEWTEQIGGMRVSPDFFDLEFGEKVTLGRHFLPEDAQAGNDHVVILYTRFWREKFGSDPNIVGKVLRMNGEPYTVIGVAAPSPHDKGDSRLVVPLVLRPNETSRTGLYLMVMGRLKPGVKLADANAEMTVIAGRLAENRPKTNEGTTVTVEALKNDFLPRGTRTVLWLMMGAVAFVLLIACVNIANLLLAWGTARQKEIAVRVAQGATRTRIFRQFLIESLSLALLGGMLGVFLAEFILRGVLVVIPRNEMVIPVEADPSLNVPVLLFTLVVSIIVGVFFGCAPAWHASRQNISDMLKEGARSSAGRPHIRLRTLLVVAEFALALILVAGAGLMIHSFLNAARADLGIQTDHVLTFQVPFENERSLNPEKVRNQYAQLLDRIEAVPGISAVAAAPGLPASSVFQIPFTIVGEPYEQGLNKLPLARFMPVTPGYYRTYGIRLARGRYLNAADRAGGLRVAMVSEGFVKEYLPNLEPLQQRLTIPDFSGATQPVGAFVEWQIVGVFHDVQYERHPPSVSAEVDVPFDQYAWPFTTIAVRTSGKPEAVTKSIAAAVRSVNPEYPLTRIRTMEQIVSESIITDRFAAVVFGSFAGLALVLAAVGIYGVMTFSVAQRNHEMGIRMALGASTGQVLRQIVGEGMRAALIGMAVGLPGAYFVGRILRSQLYNVSAIDGRALLGVTAVLLASALLACYWPARCATRIDPLVALREE